MAKKYAAGRHAWGFCGRSGKKMLLKDMVFDGRYPNMRVDPAWYEGKHPQEVLKKIDDPIALWRPAPEVNKGPTLPVLTVGVAGYSAPILTYTVVVGPAVRLAWTVDALLAPFVTLYRVYKSTDGGPFALLGTTAALSFDDSALTTNDNYSYFVVALAQNGAQTAPSNLISANGSITDVYSVPGNYTWTKNPATVLLDLIVIGGGGGGGAGKTQGNGGNAGAGQGGAGGGYLSFTGADASTFTPTVSLVVGAGGAGVPAGNTGFAPSGQASTFGAYATAGGGEGGQSDQQGSGNNHGGIASSTIAGAYTEVGGIGGNERDAGGQTGIAPATANAPSGGGGGGSTQFSGAPQPAGGTGGPIAAQGVPAAAAGLWGGSLGEPGLSGATGMQAANFAGSGGGGGGPGMQTPPITGLPAAGGAGGNGGGYGGGGGGGGLAYTIPPGPARGGAGGNGAGGLIRIVQHFW